MRPYIILDGNEKAIFLGNSNIFTYSDVVVDISYKKR